MAIAETKFPEGPGRGTDMISRRNFLQVALAGGVLAGVAPLGPASGRSRGTVAYLLRTHPPGRRIASPGI